MQGFRCAGVNARAAEAALMFSAQEIDFRKTTIAAHHDARRTDINAGIAPCACRQKDGFRLRPRWTQAVPHQTSGAKKTASR
jgi:hypothetical protein